MDPADVAFVKGVVAFVVLAGSGLSGYWLRVRARQLAHGSDDQTLARLREENAQMRAELETRMNELVERVEFTEQLLIKERAALSRGASGSLPSDVDRR